MDNLMIGVQLADVSTRCSSHPQGNMIAGDLYEVYNIIELCGR